MIKRIKVNYKVKIGYTNKYLNKVIKMELPKNELNFILFVTLLENIKDYFENELKIKNCTIVNYQIVDIY
jgi:hypothetical protein